MSRKFEGEMLAAPLPEDIQKLKWHGDFETALRVIERRLKKDIPRLLRMRLLAEREILALLPGQYPYSWEDGFAILQENISDFTREEFQELWEEDAMEWIYVHGQVHFKENFLENLVKTREWLCKRLVYPALEEEKLANAECLNRTIADMKEHGGICCRFHMRSRLKLKEEAEREGERLKVYLPVPVEYAQVESFQLLKAVIVEEGGREILIPVTEKESRDSSLGEEGYAVLAPAHAPQRTVMFDVRHKKGSQYQIEYQYQVRMPYLNCYGAADVSGLEPGFHGAADASRFEPGFHESEERKGSGKDKKQEIGRNQGPLKEQGRKGWIPVREEDMPCHYLGEQLPHIHFSSYLKGITQEIVGEERDPLQKARRIYDYITTHLMYSYVRSYFSITGLVDYGATGWKGDCGIQALLFITMCRIAGVPARWQSGLYTRPGAAGCHDWAMFYVEDYGWLFADCSFGGSAGRMGCEERRRFYFGNLDPFRMPSCCQFQADFIPPVKGLRHDPYDNQTGEAEYEDRMLRGEEIETDHQVEEFSCEAG